VLAGDITTNEDFARLSHDHLVTHLAGWTTKDEICLLFPTPQLTLRDLMRAPRSNVSDILPHQLFGQLFGLAEAVYFLHKIDYRDDIAGSSSEFSRTGFHYDIKPENIHLFACEDGLGYDWKLGNFGADITNSSISGAPRKQIKDHRENIYQSPETAIGTSTSRSSDIWSLGCVYLEILTWFYLVNDGSDKGIDRFWEINKSGKVILSKSVTESLEILESRTESVLPLHDLVKLVREGLLVIHPTRRETASTLVQDLGKLLDPQGLTRVETARIDLENVSAYPEDAVSEVERSTSPPSTMPDLVFSDRASQSSYSTSGSVSLHANDGVGGVDGWNIAELGLGVEPHFHRQSRTMAARGNRSPQNASISC
jgi:serine/threonine protein kinase